MWTGRKLLSELHQQSCWKVSFFCGETSTLTESTFSFVALENIVEERREFLDPQDYSDKLQNYLGLENIQPITGDLVNFSQKYGKTIKSKSKVFYPGDILYGRLRPYLNKVYLAEEPVSSGICSGEFYVLVPRKDRVFPNLLRTVLTSDYIQKHVCQRQTGTALPRLQLRDLLKIEIPLPPLDMQVRYEEFLLRENIYRRQLVTELSNLPQRILGAIEKALETGEEPVTHQALGHLKG